MGKGPRGVRGDPRRASGSGGDGGCFGSLLVLLGLLAPLALGVVPIVYVDHDHGETTVLLAVTAAVGVVYGGYMGVWNAILGGLAGADRRIAEVPVVRLGALAAVEDGALVFTSGTVAPREEGRLVRGPLSGRDGVWSETWIRIYGPNGRSPHALKHIQEMVESVPFVIEEAGARVTVDVAGPHRELAAAKEVVDRSDRKTFDAFDACLARGEHRPRDHDVAEIHERVLCVGERVLVLGVVRQAAGGSGYREAPATVSLVGDARDSLLVTTELHHEVLGREIREPRGNRRFYTVTGLLAFAVGAACLGALVLGVH